MPPLSGPRMVAMTISPPPATAGSAIDIAECFTRFTEQWAPQRIAAVNDYDVRIAKIQGEFVWHAHHQTDEFFLVVSGHLTIRLRTPGSTTAEREVSLAPGQIFVVPRGLEHCPVATDETAILMFEPASEPNTGDAAGERTREPGALC